jgi:hypothetical protein
MFVSKEEYLKRYEICKSCDSFINLTKQCKECSCFMQIKCKFSGVRCPKDYWGPSETVSTEYLQTVDIQYHKPY